MVRVVGSTCITGILLVAVLATRGRFEKIFSDFGYVDFPATLPALTNAVRSACFVWLAGTLFGLTIVKEFLLKNKRARATCDTAAICGAVLLGTLYAIGMLLPLDVLIERISK